MPRLSVVVPVHNVGTYLPGFLDALRRQSYDDVELLFVDDGSTDGSGEILRAFAHREPRAVLLEQPNAGAGSARNRALDVASGELLAFADPDDEVPPGAWARMVGVLEQTGSELVVGSAERFGTGRTYVPPLLARNHQHERLAVTIGEAPLMLADIFLWNKVVRRDLWERHALRFPEGIDYEDQPVVTDLLLAARSFDVLTDVVYRWRERADRSSATQARATLPNLRDRLETKRSTLAAVRAHGDARLLRVLLEEVLPIDMWEHFRAAAGPATDQAYWDMLRDGVRELWNDATVPFERTRLPLRQRLMGWLTAQDRRADLVELVAFLDALPGAVPVRDGRYDHPWADEPGLPPELVVV